MEERSYRELAEHLDRLPGGFAPSDTGAELRLLQRLFTPEEAALATKLTLNREEAEVIARRGGLSPVVAEKQLDEMARKGLIFSVQPGDGPTLYQAVPWVVGIYEFQVNNLSEGLVEDIADFHRTRKQRPRAQTIPQMRTIPVGKSIDQQLEALPYEQVHELVEGHSRYAVSPCICRRHAEMKGGGCDAPEESCLMFGDWADYAVRGGRGRYIQRSEVKEILERADDANLVLQPSNSRDIAAICCCCGCCCGVLRGLQRSEKPAEIVASAFVARLEPDTCQACWACLERCQMNALSEDGDTVELDIDRCIGCGLCTTTCPSGALTLVRKPESTLTQVPVTFEDAWRKIAQAQAEAQ